ncbi:hypothetical protein Pmani_030720 [Petrolisthes manimaculis]|uniref:Metalloendopeptidase n=1 Tax=Petrolisthes manimaculis TaxID=1843537 RepID=A0AAE1TTB1_9EUCA|nr:hypothetical protein Pmani_030720 [Petrolisthes manimaculis]
MEALKVLALLVVALLSPVTSSIVYQDETSDATLSPGDDEVHVRQYPSPVTVNSRHDQPPLIVNDSLITDFMEVNPLEVDGMELFEGDIMLTKEQWRMLKEERKFQNYGSELYKWQPGPSGFPLVPYRFESSVAAGSAAANAIAAGIAHWESNTCLQFEQTTNTAQPHLRFIVGSGCWSYIGRLFQNFPNGQQVSIGRGCETMGIVAHEIGHAIGFNHEQSRSDRDDYVVIHFDNIRSSASGNFNQRNTIDVVTYDYESIMHYSTKAFSFNGFPTISTIDSSKNHLIGNRDALTFNDILLANLMYGCITSWEDACGMSSDSCEGEGYIGASCSCVCPPDTTGSNCETPIPPPAVAEDGCTQTITTETTFTSPSTNGLSCTVDIQAPECHTPVITFTQFRLYQKVTCENNQACCYYDSLELREDYPNTASTMYCSTDLAGQTITAGSQRVVLFYFKRWSSALLEADITFAQVPGCEPATPTTTTSTSTTSTSTTSTSTTTTSTSTSTTEPPTPPKCTIEVHNGVFYWISPLFDENYPNGRTCRVSGYSNTAAFHLKSIVFDLDTTDCQDYVLLTTLFGKTQKYCGDISKINFKSPSFNFILDFVTNDMDNSMGFNISLAPRITPNQDCHEVITLEAGQEYTLDSPFFGQGKQKKKAYCEWRLVAPEGSTIQVKQLISRIKPSSDCNKDFLLLNGNMEKLYPSETSLQYCSVFNTMDIMTTETNMLYVAYQKKRAKTKGFRLKAMVV